MPSAAYQIVPGALPDFRTTYFPAAAPYYVAYHDVTPFEVGGVSYVVVNLGQLELYGHQGQVTTGPAANREVIFQADPSGHLVDVTQQLMGPAAAGPNGLSLNSLSAQVVIADINGDGRPDILVAENSEDGRASVDASASNKLAQSQVHLSQPDGTYKLVNIGDPLWGALGSFQVVNSGGQTLIHLSGIDNPPTAPTLNSGGLFFYEQPIYRLNSDGLTFAKAGYAPTYNYGSVILSETQMVTLGGGSAGTAFALAVNDGAGAAWRVSSQLDPFPAYSVNGYYSWNNEFSTNVTVRSVDGVQLFEAFYALDGKVKASATGPDLFVGNLTGVAIANKEADGYYHASDAFSLNRFFLLEIDNGALRASSAKLIGENLSSSPRGVQLLDLNGDGLTDIVATNVAFDRGGMPDVYMNDGHGHFLHVDPAIFPATPNETSSYGTFIKVGDHYDLMVNPAIEDDTGHQEPVYLKSLGAFPYGVYAMSAAELAGNLSALQVDFAEGHLTSIALEDKVVPTLALTAAQLAADQGVLSKVTSAFAVTVDGSAPLWVGNNLDTSAATAAETIDLAAGHQSNIVVNGSQITLTSRSDGGEAHGGAGSDILRGGGLGSRLFGGGGADTISGGEASANYMRGEDGNDSILSGVGFDDINGNKGDDTIDGGPGGNDWLVGGQGNDLIVAHSSWNIEYGNIGNDTIQGGTGADWLRGGQGDDSIVGGSGNNFISGDRGNDTESGGAGADTFNGFSGIGTDRVLDFHISEGDKVQLDPGTVWSASQVGADTVIDLGSGDKIVLVGVQFGGLPPGWIFGA